MLLDFLKDGLDPTYLCMMVPVTWREQVSCLHFPLLYVHCASHCLNLAVVSSLEVVAVRNMIVECQLSSLHIPSNRGSLRKQLKQHSQNLLFIS